MDKYDGSTPKTERNIIRAESQIVLTNPDMLHVGILSNHGLWRRFFSNLKLVALDEAHEYRGIFGSNVAFLLRRLQEVTRLYGGEPTFVAASATASNAVDHVHKLTNLEMVRVGEQDDGSARGVKTYFLCRAITGHAIDAATKLTLSLVDKGLSVLTFCPSRTVAEKKFYAAISSNPTASRTLAVYRAGLHADERERIEAGLKQGDIRGVFSTSALELGVDIGQLDACILIGFPPTMMSMWQRSGRVGRGGKDGAVIVIGSEGLVDNYFLNHPSEFYQRTNERLVTNLDNPRVLRDHLACALKEMDGQGENLHENIIGKELFNLAQIHKSRSLEHPLLYVDAPHTDVNIRNVNDYQYDLTVNGESIGDISRRQILREAYEGAVYYHGGKRFRVRKIIDRPEYKGILQPENSTNETRPNISIMIQRNSPLARTEWPHMTVTYGHLKISQSVSSYEERTAQNKVVETKQTARRSVEFPTLGLWVEFRPEFIGPLVLKEGPQAVDKGILAVEHLLAGLMPVISPCDPNDYDSKSTFDSRKTGAIYIYDNVYGGVGLSEEAFKRFDELVIEARKLVNECVCQSAEGCPYCVGTSRCFDTRPVGRSEAIKLLDEMLEPTRFALCKNLNLGEDEAPKALDDLPLTPADEAKSSFMSYRTGSQVKHLKFGVGKVLGNTAKLANVAITIAFVGGSRTIIVAPYLTLVTGEEVIVCRYCGNECPPGAILCPGCSEPL